MRAGPLALFGTVLAGAVACLWVGGAPPENRRYIKRGETHLHRIALPAGHFARLAVDQREIGVLLSVIRPDGSSLMLGHTSPFGRKTVAILATAPGVFTVRVHAEPRGPARGAYDLAILEKRPGGPLDRVVVEAQDYYAQADREANRDTAEAYERAIALYAVAAAGFHTAGDARGEADALVDQGGLYDRTARWEQANQCYHRGLKLWDGLQDEYGRLETLRRIGRLQGHFRERPPFLPTEFEFLDRWRRLGDRRGIANALAIIGDSFLRAGKLRESLEFQTQGLQVIRALGDRWAEARILEGVVIVYREQKHLKAALAIATNILRTTREMGDTRGEAAALGRIAFVLKLDGRHREAAELLVQALQLRRAQGDWSAVALVHHALGTELRAIGDLTSALKELKAALTLEESLTQFPVKPQWRAAYFGTNGHTASYVDTLVEAKQEEAAFLAADRAHGRVLADRQPAQLDTVQSVLDEDDILLEFWLGDDRSFLWAVTKHQLRTFILPRRNQIAPLAKGVYQEFASRHGRVSTPAAWQLSRILLGPITGEIRGKRLVIVGDGMLHYLPFAALPDPGRDDGVPLVENHEIVNLPSALAHARLRHSRPFPSTSVAKLALVADPVFDSNDPRLHPQGGLPHPDPNLLRAATAVGLASTNPLPRLGYSGSEGRFILSSLPASIKATSLFGFDATREALLSPGLQQHDILHLSTHGFVNDEDPDLSGLALSLVNRRGQPIDGFFRLRDLSTMRLSARLVVMSACQTALGRENPGEGIIGLTGGFLQAGAATVISTAWSVTDEATAELMRIFYRRLLGSGQRPAAALRAAQIELRQQPRWRAPHYWAGFLVHGEWR